VGFYAKFAILQALITTNVTSYLVLAVIAVLLSLIGAFYYLRVVKIMYFDEPTQAATVGGTHTGVGALLACNGAAALVLGLLPDGLMALCRDVIVAALAG
jgi:NADH-quinone oxidoreductase subunit N